MKTFEEAVDSICDLKGSVLAQMTVTRALLRALPPAAWQHVATALQSDAESARGVLLGSPVSEHTIAAFDRDVQLVMSTLDHVQGLPQSTRGSQAQGSPQAR